MHMKSRYRINQLGLTVLCLSILSACGGGDNNGTQTASTPAQPSGPTLAAAITLEDGASIGNVTFPKGATPTGGLGQIVSGLNCEKPVKSSPAYGFTHLNLIVDGQKIAIPEDIGQIVAGSSGIARRVSCCF